ncbi:MAG: type VI secretion system baseplate subunit TssG [Rheinheimera sp.]|uniref:type VI secretion system baseplate subunit TssG n=1 Tax=Arsukibacterium sp. UBA3155 TaxID=1946058 RepID=UPI000C8DA6E3|nr:type VI secretion system baseplate subunit TssG [Arsukibacterium sp. UBA3155]MAD75902.1 type VI secretion system baseplate subunit TssG [Rheinheimera sp.]|tara:strand:- start:65902 stop:66897 length:996 start_codon:yes stop_codon:yes gene_type:complete
MSFAALVASPGDFDFYQAVYQIERQLSAEQKKWHGVGRDAFPGAELVRFKAEQHLGFAGQPINKANARTNDNDQLALELYVSFLGLTGPSGVMPQHYTEMLLQRLKQRDGAMRDFFDMFNHRLISLYYRAWEKYRFACQYEIANGLNDPFSTLLQQLSGCNDNLGLYYAGAFSQRNRSSQFLQQILTDLLGAPVKVISLAGRWLALAKEDQSRLSSRTLPEGQNGMLGQTSMLGQQVWDVSSVVVIEVAPPANTLAGFLPGASRYQLVQHIAGRYLDPHLQVRLVVKGRQQDFPCSRLADSTTSLGRGSRLSIRAAMSQHPAQVGFQLGRL